MKVNQILFGCLMTAIEKIQNLQLQISGLIATNSKLNEEAKHFQWCFMDEVEKFDRLEEEYLDLIDINTDLNEEIQLLNGDIIDLKELNSSLNAKLLAERQKHGETVKALMGEIGELKRKAVRKKTAPKKREVPTKAEQFSLLEEKLEQLLHSAGVDIDLPPLENYDTIYREVYHKCQNVGNGDDIFNNPHLTPSYVRNEARTLLASMKTLYPQTK